LTWKVLLVDPCTPGHAPVARLYQPAPVFGGDWVSSPPLSADAPFCKNSRIVGIKIWPAKLDTRSCRKPSEAKNSTLSVLGLLGP
jgi:hypothetical protein